MGDQVDGLNLLVRNSLPNNLHDQFTALVYTQGISYDYNIISLNDKPPYTCQTCMQQV